MNETLFDAPPTFFGLTLSTHRFLVDTAIAGDNDDGHEPLSAFPFEAAIAALSISFFRYTVLFQEREPAAVRYFFCGLLAALAFSRKSYELLAAVETFSYVVSWLLLKPLGRDDANNLVSVVSTRHYAKRLLEICAGALLSMAFSHAIFTSDILYKTIRLLTPQFVVQLINYLFPVAEITTALGIMGDLVLHRAVFRQMVQHLLFVTFHIQVGMGYLGIRFLTSEQNRRNQLIRLDVKDEADSNSNDSASKSTSNDKILERSRRFQRSAAPFIFMTALPYMFQIIAFGNINKFSFSCVQDEMHRTIRVHQVFSHDNHLTAMALDSATSPEAYAASMNKVVETVYDIFNRKLFSLPKVLLLPSVMSRQPLLILQVFPFIFVSDWLKASAVSFMTAKIESFQKQIQEISSVRSKVESFDIKNAELLQRSGNGATRFTRQRWEELTVKVQSRVIVSDLLTRSKAFFAFMQRNFVFTVLIDCALANLIAIGKIGPSEIFVFSRAIEDAVDMVLMRSRSEAELARMMTEIEKLEKLGSLWESSKAPNLLPCHIGTADANTDTNHLILRNLHYSRGTAMARADHIELQSGVYALTGSNGSGKSTLFRILMSCHTNEKSIDLPSSINLLTPAETMIEEDDILREKACIAPGEGEKIVEDDDTLIETERALDEVEETHHVTPRLSITLPSSRIVEISQNFYWPLYSKPIDWIHQDHVSETYKPDELKKRVRKIAEELHSLEFFQSGNGETAKGGDDAGTQVSDATAAEATIERIMYELQEEKEDWFSDLSGGQKSKVELVRTVFLRDSCPDVLLVDETMAPLDPASKELVMAKLKMFCSKSIIVVIYHTDVGQGKDVGGKRVDCVPSNSFFDKNIHLERGIVHVRDTC